MNYKFEYQLSENDYFEFNKYHLNNSIDSKMGLLLQKISLPITFIIILLFNIMQGIDKIQILIFFVVFTIASILWILTSKKTNEHILKRYINFIKKHSKLPYSESAVMEFYDEYFIEKTQTTKSEIQYKAIHKININEKNAIYIYQNEVQAYIIPFTLFSSDEERTKFINFIQDKAGITV